MTVVIGYIPNPYGEAALQVGLQEAEARNLRVIVVNATRGEAYVDKRFVNEKDLADIPKNVLDTLDVHMVSTMDDVLKIALERPLTPLPPSAEPAGIGDAADAITH